MHAKLNFFLFSTILWTSSCQKIWHSNFMGLSGKPRNEFVLRNVSLDQNFSLNATVEYWRSLNSRFTSYAVGVSKSHIFILNVTKKEDPRDFEVSVRSKDVDVRYIDGTIFNVPYKNEKHGETYFVAVASGGKLEWINAENLEIYWSWNLGFEANNIKFSLNNVLNDHQLFLTSKNKMHIYNFDLNQKQSWLYQTLDLPEPIGIFDMVPFRNNFFLLIPQKNLGKLLIYRYENYHYQPFKNITAEQIDQVVAFQINYKSFFAVDGLESSIYRFDKRNKIIQEHVKDSHLEGIKYWMPLKVNNLRKNFILFGQRVTHHGPVKSFVTETFTYNGDYFEEHEDIPCQIFGEEFNSLNCLASSDAVGIQGAAAVSSGNNLGLLLAKRTPHNLFRVNFEVKNLESPAREKIKELKDVRKELQKLLDEKLKNSTPDPLVAESSPIEPIGNDPIKTSESQRKNTSIQIRTKESSPMVGTKKNEELKERIDKILDRLEQLQEKIDKVLEMEKKGDFKKVIMNGRSRINEVSVESLTAKQVNDDDVDEILEDIVRKNRNKTVAGTKTFTDLNVKNLFFNSINGVKSQDIMFLESDDLVINGNVTFEEPVAIKENIVTDIINGLPFSSIPDTAERIDGTLSFENLIIDNLDAEVAASPAEPISSEALNLREFSFIHIPGNATVRRINGEDFEMFMKQLCLVNIPNHIPGNVEIKGTVTFDQPSSIGYMNDIKFPEDYVLTSQKDALFISGKKVFRKSLITNVLNTNDNYINEYKSADFFTLTTPQHVPGNATFTKLEITEKFSHNGEIIGNQLEDLLPNPTLAETFNVKANVNFERLEVTGSVIVENMDGLNYGRILEDIIYKDEEGPEINSIKEFSEGLTVRNSIEITTNSINKISLDQIVTRDSPQILNIPVLNGNVSIRNMQVEKLIGDVNITKLDEESVKIVGEQFISSFLMFDEDLIVKNLEIKEILNEEPVENYALATGDRILTQKPSFFKIQVENLSVLKNIKGNLTDFDVANFEKSRLTYSTSQNIKANIHLVNSETVELDCKEENDLCRVVLDEEKLKDALISKISSGKISVKELIAEDDVNVKHIDGIILGQSQELRERSSVIDGDVYFKNLRVSKLSGVPISEVLEDCVYKNETDVEIKGLKVFQNGFVVKKLIETELLNKVPVQNLMTKQGEQIIEAPLEIYGNVTFDGNVNIWTSMNDVPVQEIKEYFEYRNDKFFIKGDIMFNRLTYIKNLDVNGFINGKNVHNVMNNIAHQTETKRFLENVEFKGPVFVEGNLDIENNLNGISLSDSNDNIVYLNKMENNTVESLVTFTSDNVFAHNLLIENDLVTNLMRGLNLSVIKENAVFLNQGFLKGTYRFKNMKIHGDVLTNLINNVNMSRTIPLRTDQDINRLIVDNAVLLRDAPVKYSVNGFDLETEYNNTVFKNKYQEISSEIYFKNNTLIKDRLEVEGLLNGHRLDGIVTTDTNQILRATYEFTSKTAVESNMYVTGYVNSINMSVWENGALKLISEEPQAIQAPWHFAGNLTFVDTLESVNGIYGFDVGREYQLVEDKREYRINMEAQYKKDYKNICKDIRAVNEESKKQTYKFDSLEEMANFNYVKPIGKAHFFHFEKPSLILNAVSSCTVDLLHIEDRGLVRNNSFEMGELDQVITVHEENSIFFVVKSKKNGICEDGTMVWKYQNGTLKKIQIIDNQQLLQESLVPLTFYGLSKNGVTEFRIDMSKAVPVEAYRKWKIREEEAAFMPRGIGTGLAVRTGKKLIKLLREEPLIDNEIGFENAAIKGEMKIFDNDFVPGRSNDLITVVRVGPKEMRRTFLAVVFHEDTIVGRSYDVLKIYEDYSEKRIFQKILTYNPTSVVSLEMTNGETLLLILEDGEKLQIYSYRGIEGFRKYLSAPISGTKMFKMSLPVGTNERNMETVAVVNNDKLIILKPVMTGNPFKENIECL